MINHKHAQISARATDREGNVEVRRSVFETAKYQLSHASIRTDCVRPHVVTWFGVCSYRKLKVVFVPEKPVCPICNGELRRVRFSGNQYCCVDRDSPNFKSESLEPLRGDGSGIWEYVPECEFGGSGSYGRRYGWNGRVLF